MPGTENRKLNEKGIDMKGRDGCRECCGLPLYRVKHRYER